MSELDQWCFAWVPKIKGKTRAALLKANHRDAEYWFIRARLEARMRESSM